MNLFRTVTGKKISRRTTLRGAGAAIGLPLLEAMQPAFAREAGASSETPRRILAINLHLGFMKQNFFPAESGTDYQLTKYLKLIQSYRRDFTLISGTSHPGVAGAHESDQSFLTAAPGVGQPNFRNTLSFDQIAAAHYAGETRFSHLPLCHRDGKRSLAWSASGANIPPISDPIAFYEMLFLEGTPREKAQQRQNLRDGRSVMDSVMEAASSLSSQLGSGDKRKLDQYFTSVRETERGLLNSLDWVDKPKPNTDYPAPKKRLDPAEFVSETALMYDLIHLALETDSSRVITYNQPNLHKVLPADGVRVGYHALSHHNNDPKKMQQLEVIELKQMEAFAKLLEKLTSSQGASGRLLDHTQVLLGSNFGDASTHNTHNLPIILAGGGFRHGQHLAFDHENNKPLSNLFVLMLQRLGIEQDSFGSSTGTLTGLAPATG